MAQEQPQMPLGLRMGQELLLLGGFFLVGEFIAMTIAASLSGLFPEGSRESVVLLAVLQGLLAFVAPALVYGRIVAGRQEWSLLRLNVTPGLKNTFFMLILFAVAIPALNQIIYWNSEMHLPAGMETIEQKWREMEEINTAFTTTLTSGSSIGSLISALLIVGVVAGVSEELMFRSALISCLRRGGVGVTASIWIAAFIFSFMHFQFFGFVPRLLLGVWFGYLFVSSGSVWLSATAHVANNSLVVIFVWLSNRGLLSADFENIGVSHSGFPWIALLSALVFGLLLWRLRISYRSVGNNILTA